MLNRIIKGLCLALALLVALPGAEAAIFKCTDAMGRLPAPDHACGPGAVSQTSNVPPSVAAAVSGHHLLWKVTGHGGTAYLVGSIHFGTPDMYPLPVVMTKAYQASQALVVETNLTALDPPRMARVVAAKAMFHDGRTLSQVLKPQTLNKLDQALQQFGASVQLMEQQKPWFVSMTLTSLALRSYGFNEELGIDNHFMKLANKAHKPILEMETFQQQLDYLDGFSEAEQEEMLEETFQDLDKGKQFLADTLQAWRAGDVHKIDQMMNEELRDGGSTGKRIYQVLIAQRNQAMAERLDGMLKSGGSYFVVLGSAHFVGRDGIVALLKAKGYQVQQQ